MSASVAEQARADGFAVCESRRWLRAEDDAGRTQFEYSRSVGAHGHHVARAFDAFVGSKREIWIGDDGSGMIRSTGGPVEFFDDAGGARWEAACSPSPEGGPAGGRRRLLSIRDPGATGSNGWVCEHAEVARASRQNGKAQGMRITHLGLSNWRNFPKVDVDLAGRTFLVGPNASGKSNFLDAIRFLHDLVAVGGGFEDAVGKRGGVSAVRSLAARRYPDVGVRIALGTDEDTAAWEYEVSFAQDNRQRPLVKTEIVRESRVLRLKRPDDADQADPARLSQTHLEQVNVNREFRVVADFLRTIQFLHIVPQLVREPERSVGRTNDPFGGDFVEQIARTPSRTRQARLRRILEALRIAVPQLQQLELDQDIRGVHHLRGKYEHWRPQGAWQTEADFSDGTLRLLGLLWALLERGGPLLLEEPELIPSSGGCSLRATDAGSHAEPYWPPSVAQHPLARPTARRWHWDR